MDIAKLAGITPGTWTLKKIQPNDERETYMLTNGKRDIAYLMGGRDAELIKHAPQLLDMCIRLYANLDQVENPRDAREAKTLLSKFINPRLL